jgi:hypothetical protein
MKVPWRADQCIICLERHALTEEHVIPESLRGNLKCDFLCKPCNDSFGSAFEAEAKTNPAIRLAVSRLQLQIPSVHSKIEHGQQYTAESGPASVPTTGSWVIWSRKARLRSKRHARRFAWER